MRTLHQLHLFPGMPTESTEWALFAKSMLSIGALSGLQWFPGVDFAASTGIGASCYSGSLSENERESTRFDGWVPALKLDIGYAWYERRRPPQNRKTPTLRALQCLWPYRLTMFNDYRLLSIGCAEGGLPPESGGILLRLCGRRDLNPHALWAPPPQDGASANFATSAISCREEPQEQRNSLNQLPNTTQEFRPITSLRCPLPRTGSRR